jgi:hypothetical protein
MIRLLQLQLLLFVIIVAHGAQVPLHSDDARALRRLLQTWSVLRRSESNSVGAPIEYESGLPMRCPMRSTHFECDGNGRIVRFLAADVALSGSLPRELGALTRLEHLDLNSNQLSGDVSSLVALSRLTLLDLSANQFVAPLSALAPLFTAATDLQVLKLHSNAFHGSINASVASLSSLATLHLHRNSLSGQLPPRWAASSSLDSCILAVQGADMERNCFSCPLPAALPPACTATPVFAATCSTDCGSVRDETAARAYVFNFTAQSSGGAVPSLVDALTVTREALPRFVNDAVRAPLTVDIYALPQRSLIKSAADGIGCVVMQFTDAVPIVRKLFQLAIVVRSADPARQYRIASLQLSEFRAQSAVETAVIDVGRRVYGANLSAEAFAANVPPPLAIDDAMPIDKINIAAAHAPTGFAQLGAAWGDVFVVSAGPFSSFRLAAFKLESAMLIDIDKPVRTRTSTQASEAEQNATETPKPTKAAKTPKPSKTPKPPKPPKESKPPKEPKTPKPPKAPKAADTAEIVPPATTTTTMADDSSASVTNTTMGDIEQLPQHGGGIRRMRIFIGIMVLVMVGFNVRYAEE